jgi:hypothetical protein
VAQLIGSIFTSPSLPKRRPASLKEFERRALTLAAKVRLPDLLNLGLPPFGDLERFVGTARGPGDIESEGSPIWCICGDAAGGVLPVEAAVRAWRALEPGAALDAWAELAGDFPPYGLRQAVSAEGMEEHGGHAWCAYGLRFAELLASVSVEFGAPGEALAVRLAEEELAAAAPGPWALRILALALAGHAARRGEILDPRWDPCIEHPLRAAPVAVNLELSARILERLPPERAGRLALSRWIFRVQRTGKGDEETRPKRIEFNRDCTALIRRFPSEAATCLLLEALETHAALKASGDLARARADWPIPEEALRAYFDRAPGIARSEVEASVARRHLHAPFLSAILKRWE